MAANVISLRYGSRSALMQQTGCKRVTAVAWSMSLDATLRQISLKALLRFVYVTMGELSSCFSVALQSTDAGFERRQAFYSAEQ